MKPQLAAHIGPRFNRFPAYVQPKLNGVRCMCQMHGGVAIFMSRDEKLWHAPKLRHLQTEIESIKSLLGDRILDGELYVHGWNLQTINGSVSVNSAQPRHDTKDIEFHVFDVVNPDLTFSDRWFPFNHHLALQQLPHVKVVPTTFSHSRAELNQAFHHYAAQDYEGIMVRPDGPYVFGKTPHGTRKNSPFLWKYKAWKDDEFVCVGVTQGEGKADIGIGALVCITRKGVQFNVGTGFDDATRVELMANPPIGKQIKVRYIELTSSGVPFNNSFLCVV